jgi:hypothetical protein
MSVLHAPCPLQSFHPLQQFGSPFACDPPGALGLAKPAARLLLDAVFFGGGGGRDRSAAGISEGALLGAMGALLDAVEAPGAAGGEVGALEEASGAAEGASGAAEEAGGAAEEASGREGTSGGSSTLATVWGCPPHPERPSQMPWIAMSAICLP